MIATSLWIVRMALSTIVLAQRTSAAMTDHRADVLILGTGNFAGRIALDLAVTASEPLSVVISGRNRDRLNWLRTAGNARAALFKGAARFATLHVDLAVP